MSGNAAAQANWKPKHNPWAIAVVVTLATFMEVLDTSIANVALPHIAGGLSAGQDEATWVLTSYLVSNAIVLPISGWLSTLIGRKRFYMGCVVLFVVSSILCGFAPSLGWLIVFRVLQGLGGGGLAPSEQAILTDSFPPEKRGMASALYGFGIVFAPAVGPTLGGWITESFSWRWIFFINIPVGILSLALTSIMVEDPPYLVEKRRAQRREGVKIDYLGFGLVALGLACLQIVLDKGQRDDWFDSSFITTLVVIAAITLVAFVFRELNEKNPIVDLPLMRDRTFLVSNILIFAFGFALFGGIVLLPLYVQTLLGYTATEAGLVITPGGFVIMALMPVVGILVSKVQPRWLVMFGFAVSAGALFHLTHFNAEISYSDAAWARVYQGVGLAFLFVPINTAAYSNLPRDKSSNASALLNVSRNLGASFGISFVTTMLARREQFHQSRLIESVSFYDLGTQSALESIQSAMPVDETGTLGVLYEQAHHAARTLAFLDCFWMLAISCLIALPLVFLMGKGPPGRPAAH